ncbi:MAG: primosomal protein N' [Lachnospiraceae bacterium]|nr:primosomal protein N' [Lachnospiraceae bacterium]
MSSCKYADVIVDISSESVDRPFTYRIPEELTERVSAGSPVIIPFGQSNSRRKGYVVRVKDEPDPELSGCRIKDIESVAEKTLSVEDELIELSVWLKDRYGCTLNSALATVMPVKKAVKARSKVDLSKSLSREKYDLHIPNEEQKKVIDTFVSDYDNGFRKTYLLYGITGSGKTDAYMHMVQHVIRCGKQAVILIPEISLTYQAVERFYSVFGSRVAVIHSKLSQGERYDQIKRCLNGEADIIIGPRSAVFVPFNNIGIIVIDEEHDTAYKNETVPRYNTIDVAKKRAEVNNASLVLSSATPSPDSYKKALSGEYTMMKLSSRAGKANKPVIDVVDMRLEMQKGNRTVFSEHLDELIKDRLSRKEQVILFINRRGYSNFVSCRSCGNAIRCPHCDVSLTLHAGHVLKCHYCGYQVPVPDVCPHCGSPYIAEFGVGTQKLENMTRKMYPQARIARLDTDSASGKKASEKILNDFANGETDILIGTQMVVKGHDYHNVTLVGIMAADTSLYVSDYTSGQRTYELIAQASGRCGRGNKEGRVVIQTYKPEHYAIMSAAQDNYENYFSNEIAYRKILNYPPAVHIWTVQISSKDENILTQYADDYADLIKECSADKKADFMGPVEPAVYKIKDYFRKLIYLKDRDYDLLLKVKENTESIFRQTHQTEKISILHDFT